MMCNAMQSSVILDNNYNGHTHTYNGATNTNTGNVANTSKFRDKVKQRPFRVHYHMHMIMF